MTEPTTGTLDVPGAVLHYGSKRTDGADVTTPDEHADDLHRLISVLGAGPPLGQPGRQRVEGLLRIAGPAGRCTDIRRLTGPVDDPSRASVLA